jgi:uncharacterized integral membrane protein
MENQNKWKNFKVILVTVLLILILIISFQNLRKVELDLLVWKIELPLVLLLSLNTISVAIITFILVKWKKK